MRVCVCDCVCGHMTWVHTHTHTHIHSSHNSHCNVLSVLFQEACLGSMIEASATLYNNSCTDTLSTINRRGDLSYS